MLFGLAYRMLGMRADAEDVVQECYLRWRTAKAEEIRSPKSFLTTVAARLALDHLKSARVRRESYVGTWLPEPMMGPQPVEMAESLSMAFLHVLESLTPAERVAFLMREIFESDYADIAGVLDTSEANCRQLTARARARLQERRQRFRVDRRRHEQVVRSFMAACAAGDPAELFSMLREDAVLYSDGGGKANAALNPIYGADRITRFLVGISKKPLPGASAAFVDIGGEPGCLISSRGEADTAVSVCLDEYGKIRTVFLVRNPDKLSAKGGNSKIRLRAD